MGPDVRAHPEVPLHERRGPGGVLQVAELRAGWQDVFDRYDIRWVVFSSNSPLVRTLQTSEGWHVTYEDSLATVLTR